MNKNLLYNRTKIILICLCLLILVSQGAFALKKRKPFEVEIKSYDGFKIHGVMDIPNYASIETKAPLIIFLHSIHKNHKAWGNLPTELKSFLNVATLNIDLRGHGKSIHGKENKKLHWQHINPEDFKKMPEDVLEILKYVEKEYPEINSKKVAIIGASLGATMGMMAASYKENVETLILFSPMMKYKSFDLRLPIVKYGKHPLFFLVSEQDRYSYESSEELMKFAQGAKKLTVYPYGGHGEDLLRFQPESQKAVIDWLKKHFSDGKIIYNQEKKDKREIKGFKYKKVGEYFGKIKKDRDLYRGVH